MNFNATCCGQQWTDTVSFDRHQKQAHKRTSPERYTPTGNTPKMVAKTKMSALTEMEKEWLGATVWLYPFGLSGRMIEGQVWCMGEGKNLWVVWNNGVENALLCTTTDQCEWVADCQESYESVLA